MQPPHHHSGINLAELKAQIVMKLGPEGSKQYFHFLNRFLSLKLTKAEFNKVCVRILGRENISLHNQLIRSILRNACGAKMPPPVTAKDDVLKNGSHTMTSASGGGDMLPLSPRKVRSNRRSRSTLGPNGKTIFIPHVAKSSDINAVTENGDLNAPDLHQGLVHNENETFVVKDASARSPLRAPLGVPFCPSSIGGGCSALLPSRCIGTFSDNALLDSLTLRKRMEQIAVIQGLEGVSIDCADVLNHGLDVYMKGLIKSCIELVGSRSGHELTKNNTSKNQSRTKLINGVKPLNHRYQMQNSGKPFDVQECSISLQDFKVAMELNRQKLGEDWPLLIEKICICASEE